MTARGAGLYMTTPFKAGATSHGGHHRYQQLRELVSAAGLPIAGEIAASHRGDLARATAARTLLAGLAHLPFAGCGWTASPQGLFRIGAAALAVRRLERRAVFLWAPSYGAHLVLGPLARRRGSRVIALIHNIESLVPNQPCPIRPSQSNWLDLEIACLSNADVVFCHSRWDQWFLRMRGLEAHLLPYYPTHARCEWLRRIRERRLQGPIGDSIVVLGNADNPPTRLGMLEQLRIVGQHATGLRHIAIHVCGDGTTRLQSAKLAPNVQIHGYVHEDVLAQHLATAKAVWFHQPATTGVVTRIVDMLIAGVPVLANAFASRSQEALDGVHTYDLDAAVPALMRSRLATPDVPAPPDLFAQRFVSTVARMLQEAPDHQLMP
jgi:glycosyltransferase involved in cell wall biosynthesis